MLPWGRLESSKLEVSGSLGWGWQNKFRDGALSRLLRTQQTCHYHGSIELHPLRTFPSKKSCGGTLERETWDPKSAGVCDAARLRAGVPVPWEQGCQVLLPYISSHFQLIYPKLAMRAAARTVKGSGRPTSVPKDPTFHSFRRRQSLI